MVARYTLDYITDIAYVYLKYCDYNVWNFPRRTFGFNTGKTHCLLLTICFLLLCFRLNFVVQLVLYSGAHLSGRHQIYLTDMTGGPTVFQEVDRSVNPFPNKPWFLRVCSTRLLKTLWKKEKLLVTSNFTFSHSVFCPFRGLSAIFIEFKIVVCKLFQFGRV